MAGSNITRISLGETVMILEIEQAIWQSSNSLIW